MFDVAKGEARFDNFHGHWGEQQHLDRFMQAYAIEKAKLEARKRGHMVSEQVLAEGFIKVRVQVAGGAS